VGLRTALRWGLVLAALGWTASQLPPLVRSVSAGAGVLRELRWGWIAGAALLGLAAVGLYGELHRQLLAVGGARPPAGAVQSISFAQNAIGNTVPVVGGAGALAYAVAGLRRRGVDAALAAWAVLFAGVLSILCLVALGAAALTVAGRLPLPGAGLVVAGVVAAVALVVGLARHPAALRGAAARLLPVHPSSRQWVWLLGAAVVPWLADFATLVVAAAAVPGRVPWPALVEGFLVVQGSIALQVLPGGAGLAEVGLLGVLLGSGTAAGPAAAVVLVYRLSSWLLPSALGWLTYGAQLRHPEAAVGPGDGPVERQPPGPCATAPGTDRTVSACSSGDGGPHPGPSA
jgi:putative heme transporter